MRSFPWYNRSAFALIQIIIGLSLLYPLSLRAIDTGSLQQYSLILIISLFIAVKVGNMLRKEKKA